MSLLMFLREHYNPEIDALIQKLLMTPYYKYKDTVLNDEQFDRIKEQLIDLNNRTDKLINNLSKLPRQEANV